MTNHKSALNTDHFSNTTLDEGTTPAMMGTKAHLFTLIAVVSLEELVPATRSRAEQSFVAGYPS